jgi:membrane fusion protein
MQQITAREGLMSGERQLFRQQAVDFHRQQRQLGNVAALQPVAAKVTAWLLILSTAAIISFLFLGQYSRKETAVGYLTPNTGTAKVFLTRRGTVKTVHVKNGDIVTQGQPLLTVETDQVTEDGVDVNSTMLSTLSSQKELLEKNIAAEEQRVESERERLTAQAKGLQAEISQLKNQIELQGERLKVAESDLAAADHLRARGFMTAVEAKRRQVLMLEQKQGVSSLTQQLSARQNQLSETQFSLQQLPTLMAQRIQTLRNDLAATDQRIAEIAGRRAYVVRAPSSGRVSTLQASVGQNVDPQRLQLEIVPKRLVLQAELFLPARAIGFVEPGQPVRILYDAFPYQHFGTYSGRVVEVSQTILTSSDAIGPIALKEPAYRVTVALDREDIDAYGKRIPLQPDMLLKADILLEKRSLISWLTSPLTGIRV